MDRFKWLIMVLTTATHLSAQVEPHAGQWKTWVIPSGGVFRLPAPPNAAITAVESQWVKECAAARNQAALAQIHFWDSGAPGYRWMRLAQQLAVSQGLPAPMQTRALSLVAAAIYDSTVAAWDSKYTYLFPTDATALIGMAADAGVSTFDALIHTQLDVSAGLTLGGQVGQHLVARAQADGAH